MNKQLTIGLIGLGNISATHIEAYRSMANVRIAAICDSNQALLLQKAQALSVAAAYPDYRFLLRDSSIDVVDVMTPHSMHATITREAMEAGKDVLCEKPLATNINDIERIFATSKRTGKHAHVKQYLRFSEAYRKTFALLQQGVVGKPYFIQCMFTGNSVPDYKNPYTWRASIAGAGGGVFINVGEHMIDLLSANMGPVRAITARHTNITKHAPGKGEDFSSAILEFPHNVTASIATTHNDDGYRFRWEMRIYATKGVITVIDTEGKRNKSLSVIRNNTILEQFSEPDWWWKSNTRALEDCVGRIRTNTPPLVHKSHAKNVLSAILSSYTSSRTGKRISL